MEGLHDLLSADAATSIAIGGLVIGILFGAIVQKTNYCTMGSLSDLLNFGDARRLRAWVFSSAVAIAATQALRLYGGLDLSKAIYLTTTFDWLGAVVGGLVFGFGMVFAGGCGSRNLVRAGTGDLRSLVVVIVIGLTAYATIGGVLGPARAALANATSIDLASAHMADQSVGAFLARFSSLDPGTAEKIAAAAIVLAMSGWALADRGFVASPNHILGAIGVGACVAAGWALTALAYDEMASSAAVPTSLTFVRPSGDALDWIERYTAGPIPNFGVASLFGTMIGAFLAAAATGKLKLSTFFDVQDMQRNLFGAVLMGIGGVMALGCTVGQALTGAATLAVGSFLTFAGLIVGGILGMKTLENL
ncbi:MAG: YeeE/YedE family protein [Hyphomicrobiales bacterium]|nr:YeeE/YedE family protein [Hyphomicrobiales bacterium]